LGDQRPIFDNGSYVGMTDWRGATARVADSWASGEAWRRMQDKPLRLCKEILH